MTFLTSIFGNIKNIFIFFGSILAGAYILFLKSESKESKKDLEEYKEAIEKDTTKNIEKSHKDEIKIKEIEHKSKVETIEELRDIDKDIDKDIENLKKMFGESDRELVIKI